MKPTVKRFGFRLWSAFALFAAVLLAVLWLLQTVFLQSFYTGMSVSRVRRAAASLAAQKDSADFPAAAEEAARRNSLLIFLTDGAGTVLYSADEYSALYSDARGGANPYLSGGGALGGEKGALRNLPYGYAALIRTLTDSGETERGEMAEDGSSYVCVLRLGSVPALGAEDAVLCVGMTLGSVSGTVGILRTQLLWVSVLSLALSFLLAYFLARRFEKPLRSLTRQAQALAGGQPAPVEGSRGFCTELDTLSDTLSGSAAALERLERARRELLANVSHDLRTPLTMIQGYAEMVRELSWSDETARNRDLDVIIREAKRLTALVNEILAYSSLQALEKPPETAVFDLSEAVRDVAGQFAALCAGQGIALRTDAEPGLRVCGNRAQLERVIYNLIDNAVNHAGERPEIAVSLRAVSAAEGTDGAGAQ
ncbi:MAG: sensor histidine kinase, partial [Eubacteriales bacterium]